LITGLDYSKLENTRNIIKLTKSPVVPSVTDKQTTVTENLKSIRH